jgi:ankyrin repeat protein
LGINVIQCFLDNNAACVLARNEFQRLALHIACIYNDESSVDLDVIRLLFQHYPKGSEVKDYFGRVPSSYIKNSKARAIFSDTLSTAYSLSTTLSLSSTTSDNSIIPNENNDQKLLENLV